MTDANDADSETVYVSVNNWGTALNGTYHTDPDCRYLNQANNVDERPRDVLFDDLDECKNCSGEASHGGTGDGHIESLRRAARGDD